MATAPDLNRPPADRTLRVLRALWLLVEEPAVLADLRDKLEDFGRRFHELGADQRAQRALGDEMLEWARRNRHRLSLVIERALGGGRADRGF